MPVGSQPDDIQDIRALRRPGTTYGLILGPKVLQAAASTYGYRAERTVARYRSVWMWRCPFRRHAYTC